ncbi:diguanylate cyclase domain-containing protein [Psychrosphaera algicola]|uniref:Diguanylate cyclase n=2 Tax=Psychrosphaera TaxID=907197 RepID=A0ABT5FFT2_9GAMM|nr:diguanylate cyclase [Psychrosphaera sp. G1-22]MDC2890410.1 diguanylate cyclase [Psychrosphaera sp. G1-22]
MNLRPTDLLCRYAGDRFIALLPNLTSSQLGSVIHQLEQAIASYSIKPTSSVAATYLSFSYSHCSTKEFESAQSAFELLNNRMVQQKHDRTRVA